MKRILFSVCFLLGVLMIQAQPPAGDANPGDSYGEKITPDGAVNLSDVQERLAKDEVIDGKIKAKVLDLCPKKGCWVKLQVNDSTTAMVKMKEYGFFLPVSA
ncbi:MAG: DUF4920 domain-containing protein, partial [Chitinophagaceae bacterium]